MKSKSILIFLLFLSNLSFGQIEFSGFAGNVFGQTNALPFVGFSSAVNTSKRIQVEAELTYYVKFKEPISAIQTSINAKVSLSKIINFNAGYFSILQNDNALSKTIFTSKNGLEIGLEANFKSNCRFGIKTFLPKIRMNDILYPTEQSYSLQIYVGYVIKKKKSKNEE